MKRVLIAAVSLLFLSVPIATQTTEFTYQGRLRVGGVATSSPHDVEFRLFTAASGGTQFGCTAVRRNVHNDFYRGYFKCKE
jgi:hypothetical protein